MLSLHPLVASHPVEMFASQKEGGRLRGPGDPGCIQSLSSPRWGQGTVPGVLAHCVHPLASLGVKPSASSKIPCPYFLMWHWGTEKGEILAVTRRPRMSRGGGGRWSIPGGGLGPLTPQAAFGSMVFDF